MNTTSPETVTLFYDGLCPLCSREIAHYRKRAANSPHVHFVDIADPHFDAALHGLDPVRIHKEMHVKEGERVHVGVDAFLAIWRHIPGHRWLVGMANLPGVKPLLRGAYAVFAWIRPHLPRRKSACDTGTCPR